MEPQIFHKFGFQTGQIRPTMHRNVCDEPSSPYAATARDNTEEFIQPPRVESPRIVEHFYVGDNDADEIASSRADRRSMDSYAMRSVKPNHNIASEIPIQSHCDQPSPQAKNRRIQTMTGDNSNDCPEPTLDSTAKPNLNRPTVESVDGWKTGGGRLTDAHL
jgi:hypothetical protein